MSRDLEWFAQTGKQQLCEYFLLRLMTLSISLPKWVGSFCFILVLAFAAVDVGNIGDIKGSKAGEDVPLFAAVVNDCLD